MVPLTYVRLLLVCLVSCLVSPTSYFFIRPSAHPCARLLHPFWYMTAVQKYGPLADKILLGMGYRRQPPRKRLYTSARLRIRNDDATIWAPGLDFPNPDLHVTCRAKLTHDWPVPTLLPSSHYIPAMSMSTRKGPWTLAGRFPGTQQPTSARARAPSRNPDQSSHSPYRGIMDDRSYSPREGLLNERLPALREQWMFVD